MPRLDQTLRRILALSLASPMATVTACRATGSASEDAAAPPLDASWEASGADDAAPDAPDAAPADACVAEPVDAALLGEDGSCGDFVRLPCGIPPALPGELCAPSVDLCVAVCPSHFFYVCRYPAPTCTDGSVVPDADVFIECSTCPGSGGRRPVGLALLERPPAGSPVGRYFAAVSFLEAASVDAFRHLRIRLGGFGAPRHLRAAAKRAERDERRHARVTARLARRYGVVAEPPARTPCGPPLDFEAFVTENAVEGCVRETFAALLALHQAERAADPVVARAMRAVAADELRHAGLAWSVDRWARRRLTGEAERRIRRAQEGALAALRAGAGSATRELEGAAGLPSGAALVSLLDSFARALFAPRRRTVRRRKVISPPAPP